MPFWKAVIEDVRDSIGMALLGFALRAFPRDTSIRLAHSLKGFCEEEKRILIMDMEKYEKL